MSITQRGCTLPTLRMAGRELTSRIRLQCKCRKLTSKALKAQSASFPRTPPSSFRIGQASPSFRTLIDQWRSTADS